MKKLILGCLFPFLLVGCGGSSDGTEEKASLKTGIELIIEHQNSFSGVYRVNNLSMREGDSYKYVYQSCDVIAHITSNDLPEDVSSTSSLGACFNDTSECVFITDNASLRTSILTRMISITTPQNGVVDIQINRGIRDNGLFWIAAYSADVNCDQPASYVDFPLVDGVYEGFVYQIDPNQLTLDKQSLVKSEKIILDCNNGLCEPRENNIIKTYSSVGLDLVPNNNDEGFYVSTSFIFNHKSYNFWATISVDGNTIAALGYPIYTGSNVSMADCYNGECLAIAFSKVSP